jgi:hypothetical protein
MIRRIDTIGAIKDNLGPEQLEELLSRTRGRTRHPAAVWGWPI